MSITRNTSRTVLASAARNPSGNSAEQENIVSRGVKLHLDITSVTGTAPTLDVKLQAKDPVSGSWVDIAGAAFAQKTATGIDTLTVYPGILVAANVSISDVLPKEWRAAYTIGGTATPTFTFSLGAQYVV